jgi:hypothetical protein
MWDVVTLRDVTIESLAILDLMAPPPEVLVVGCGARVRRLPEALTRQLAERGIAVEELDTVGAHLVHSLAADVERALPSRQLSPRRRQGWVPTAQQLLGRWSRSAAKSRGPACSHCPVVEPPLCTEALPYTLARHGHSPPTPKQRNALSYFNFLNDEGRVVVGALLPCSEDSGGGSSDETGRSADAAAAGGRDGGQQAPDKQQGRRERD